MQSYDNLTSELPSLSTSHEFEAGALEVKATLAQYKFL